MNQLTILKKAALISCISLSSALNAMTYEKFYKQFLLSGSHSPSFSNRGVTNFSTFYEAFKRSGCGSPTFKHDLVHDFNSFYKQFLLSGSHSHSFSEKRALE